MNSEIIESQGKSSKGTILNFRSYEEPVHAGKFMDILENIMLKAFSSQDFAEVSGEKIVQIRGGSVRRPVIADPILKKQFNQALSVLLEKLDLPEKYSGEISIELNFASPTGLFRIDI